MKEEIRRHFDNPKELEQLYRRNKAGFKSAFDDLYPEVQHLPQARFWFERLHYTQADISWGSRAELLFVIMASLIAGVIAKAPAFIHGLKEEHFYPRNIGFIVFPVLTAYFAWKKRISKQMIFWIFAAMLVSALFINSLPGTDNSDTLILSCIHLPCVLLILLGFAFTGSRFREHQQRIAFLRFNGDLVVMTTLLLLAGMILTGITIGLFSLIGFSIEQFYFEYIVVMGLAAAPVVSTYVIQWNPQLISRVSPVIARIFSPLVLITLCVYLSAILISGKSLYHDRSFLLMFNMLLIGVMAIILFSISVTSGATRNKTGLLILFLLSAVTVVINGFALSAVIFRISEWGMTPNRLSVLGGNMLILINLLFVTYRLFGMLRNRYGIEDVEISISKFIPVYWIWAIVVSFIFPIVFGFK